MAIENTEYQDLLNELIALIENTKRQVVSQVNSALTILFWHVRKRIWLINTKKKQLHDLHLNRQKKRNVLTLSSEASKRQ